MKASFYCLTSLICLQIIGLLSFPLAAQDSKLSTAEWQEDLKYLQETIHQDYPFLFKKTTAEAFDEKVKTLEAAIPKLQRHEIVAGLARIVSSFEYGHTALSLRGSLINFHLLPLNLYHFNDGIFIEGVHKDYEQTIGAKITKIEGVPVKKALQAIRPIVPAENDQYFKGYGLGYLTIPEVLHAQGITKKLKKDIVLTLMKNGKEVDQVFTAIPMQRLPTNYGFMKQEGDWRSIRNQSETPYYLKNLDKIYYFEYLPDSKTVYVRYSQVLPDPSESIPDFYDRVFDFIDKNDVEKFVLDVRLNGGGNNFNNKTLVTKIIKCDKINQPGKFFTIIGRRTFSACQNLINEFDNYTNVIFVGEPSAENINFYGDNRAVELPNSKIPIRLSWAWWQDKPQWQNNDWTAPHLAVDMSFDEYRTNKDPILATALEFNTENFILDPIAHLTNLFQAGKMEMVQSESKRLVADPMYQFIDFENQFNNIGYRLMGNHQMTEALYVFGMNAELFPKSANCWDSLAEAYWKSNDIAKAKELYNKAIQMDPNGATGKNAREMLKQIEQENH